MRTYATIALAAMLVLTGACAGTPEAADEAELVDTVVLEEDAGDEAVSPACNSAFAAAAAIGDMEDTVEDIDPALTACLSIDEWIAASEQNPGALEADPVQVLLNRCMYTTAPTGPACDEVNALYPDGLYVTPYEELTGKGE